MSNGIAYSLDYRIDHTLSTPAAQIDYQHIMAEIYQKLLSGLLNWQDAEMYIQKTAATAGQDWPISPAKPVGDLMKVLIMNLVAEACAQVQEKPIGVRVALAIESGVSLKRPPGQEKFHWALGDQRRRPLEVGCPL